MNEKLMFGIGGALLGICVGIGASNAMSGDDPEKQDALAKIATSQDRARDAQDTVAALNRQVDELKRDLKAAQTSAPENLREAFESAGEFKKVVDERDALRGQVATLTKELEALRPVEAKPLTPEEVAALRTKAAGIRDRVKSLIESGAKKEEVLAAYEEIKNLGKDAYPEVFAAYALMFNNGHAYIPGQNQLGLSEAEFISLFPWELTELALTDPNKDLPAEAQISAVWGLPYGGGSKEDMIKTMREVWDTTRHDDVKNNIVYSIAANMRGSEADAFLAEIAVRGSNDAKLRAAAISALSGDLSPEVNATLDSLRDDASPAVRSAVRIVRMRADPGATGILVESFTPGTQAEKAGVQVGDIFTHYASYQITTHASLAEAKARNTENLEVTVEVYRDGSTVKLTLAPGEIGVRGTSVTKK